MTFVDNWFATSANQFAVKHMLGKLHSVLLRGSFCVVVCSLRLSHIYFIWGLFDFIFQHFLPVRPTTLLLCIITYTEFCISSFFKIWLRFHGSGWLFVRTTIWPVHGVPTEPDQFSLCFHSSYQTGRLFYVIQWFYQITMLI